MYNNYGTKLLNISDLLLITAGIDYVEPAGAFQLQAGQTRSCLSLTLNSDLLFEATEQLTGRLIGTVEQQGGAVDRNPPRVTFNPEQTVISIRDDPTESKLNYNEKVATSPVAECIPG